MLRVTFYVKGIAHYHFFEIQNGRHVFCTMSKFQASPSQFASENVGKRTKTVLVILRALNKSSLSKMLMS